MNTILFQGIILLIFLSLPCACPAASTVSAQYRSPCALAAAKDGKVLFVAEATANAVVKVDPVSGTVTGVIRVPGSPSDILVAPDGSQLYIAEAAPDGCVHIVDLEKDKITGKLPAGHTPSALAASPDGKLLYVCNRFDNTVSIVDIKSGKELSAVAVPREPVDICITPEGRYLFVANHLPAVAADRDYVAAAVTVIDTAKKKVTGQIMLPNGSTGVRGITVSPDGAHVYVTHILARYQVPTTQLERGWMNTSGLSILDAKSLKYINTVLLDDVDLGAANPWSVIVTPEGTNIVVTHAGTHEISVIDRNALHIKLKQVAEGKKVSSVSESAEDVPNDLSFLVGIRNRLGLPGNGPRCMVACNSNIYVGEYFSDSISVVPGNKISKNAVISIALGPRKEADPVRRGEMLFNDALMCFQHWQSCASCHPDGRADGLNWDLLNDGLGNPKQTKSLLLSHETPPVMITGIRPDAETAVRAGIKYIQFVVRPDEDARAIDAYCKSMKPVPSPSLADGKLTPAAQRGKNVYDKAKCSACHPAPLFTDLNKYNVGLGTGREQGKAFDTPALVEIWRTAPYLYDGRAMTMKEVLTTYNTNDSHGVTTDLTDDEINDMCEYILSI